MLENESNLSVITRPLFKSMSMMDTFTDISMVGGYEGKGKINMLSMSNPKN